MALANHPQSMLLLSPSTGPKPALYPVIPGPVTLLHPPIPCSLSHYSEPQGHRRTDAVVQVLCILLSLRHQHHCHSKLICVPGSRHCVSSVCLVPGPWLGCCSEDQCARCGAKRDLLDKNIIP